MDLNQLKTFVTVAEEEHLTRAADRLFTSQPAISAQLKALEEELKVKLFDRTPKGMKITPGGEQLLNRAHHILAQADTMLVEAKSMQGQVMGKMNIGINSDFPFLKIPSLLATCQTEHPQLELSFIHSMSALILPDIRKGQLDAGFFFGPCNPIDLSVTKLADIQLAIIIPASWPDDLCKAPIETLAELPWIYTTEQCPFFAIKEELFKVSTQKPKKNLFVDTEEGIRALIKSGTGISLLREDDALQAQKEGWGKSWQGQTPTITLNMAIHANKINSPAHKAWVELVTHCWGSKWSEQEVALN